MGIKWPLTDFYYFHYWFLKSITWCILCTLDALLNECMYQEMPCQKSVLICMSSVSSAMKWKGTVKPTLFSFFSSFTFSTRTLERELCFSQLWNTVPWQPPFCGSMILRLVATQMPGLSWAGSCSPFSSWIFLKRISILILSPFLWEWCFLWSCLG